MRILLLCHSFNSLSQRLFVELSRDGHEVSVELDINPAVSIEAVGLFRPDLVLAPFLRRAIPEEIWRNILSLVVHPGPPGDRGPNALDWAILDEEATWGVTVLQATAELDAGPVWAHAAFPMRAASKSSLYRNEVTEAAVLAVRAALEVIGSRRGLGPIPSASRWRGPVPHARRAIGLAQDDTATVLRKIRSADGVPGLREILFGRSFYLYDASPANLTGWPGTILARSGDAIARATKDGAVWIGRLRDPAAGNFKLPATMVLDRELKDMPELASGNNGHSVIHYRESGSVGFLHFDFYNGAMGTNLCRDLLVAYRQALTRDTKAIVLMGGTEFWANGMDLNRIEAAMSPGEESWANINAIDDLAEAVIRTTDRLTITALRGNAGAGGVFLARAADEVWAHDGIVLNPHYKDMGNLFGSEFWTYLLPSRVGAYAARHLVEARLPIGAGTAIEMGLIDRLVGSGRAEFSERILALAHAAVDAPDLAARIEAKAARRTRDESKKPLSVYRAEELARMRASFFGFDQSYHAARFDFVTKVPKSRTPATIARHRRLERNIEAARLAS